MRTGVSWMRIGVSWMRIGLNQCGIFECKLNADSKNSEISVEELLLNHSYRSLPRTPWCQVWNERSKGIKVGGHEPNWTAIWAKVDGHDSWLMNENGRSFEINWTDFRPQLDGHESGRPRK